MLNVAVKKMFGLSIFSTCLEVELLCKHITGEGAAVGDVCEIGR